MRIFIAALLMGGLLSIGFAPSPAFAGCKDKIAEAEAAYAKHRSSKKKQQLKKLKEYIMSAKEAIEAGDKKTCNAKMKKAKTPIKNISS